MWSTVTDFARLDAALHSGRLLSEHALATLEAPVSSRTRKIGCCWIVSDFLGHRANIDGAHGAGDGFYAIIERFPDDDVITLVFTNLGGSGVFPAADLLSTFALDAGVLNGRLTVVRGWPSLPGPLIPTSQTTFVPTYAPSVELAFEVDATGRATVELPRVGA